MEDGKSWQINFGWAFAILDSPSSILQQQPGDVLTSGP
jgi:hypothetical protein